jgi:exodeoxyribonuclease III
MGDFNVAPTDDEDYDRPAFEGPSHVAPAEHAAFATLH